MTAQEVIKAFMAKLANHGYTSSSNVGTNMLNDAVKASSDFLSIQNVIDSMKADQISAEREAVEDVLGSAYAGKTLSDLSSSIRGASAKTYDTEKKGNAYFNSNNDQRTTVERLIKERKAYIFLEKYCGIQLENNFWITSSNASTSWTGDTTGNVDTGAITGSDANITLTAGDEFYGTTLTSDLMTTLAQQDGVSLSGDTLIIGTGIEKTRESIVPEIGNKYTAATAQAQNISTGSHDWIVVTGDTADTIVTGGADSIVASGGNDKITVGADYASILTGAGSDTVEISSEVTNVTLGDLDSNDTLTISGTFQVGSAKIEDTLLVVTDKTGTRQIRLGDLDNAKNARVNGTTLATWLSNAGININTLSSTSSANVLENSTTVEVDGGGRIAIDDEYQSAQTRSDSATEGTQDIATNANGAVKVNLDDVTITEGSITAGGTKVGAISNEFPNVSSFTKNGLTINLLGVTSDKSGGTGNIKSKTLDQLTDDQKTIVAGLFKWWGKECLNLNEDSYGIGFKSPTAMVNEIGLYFYDSGSSGNTLATVWNTTSGNKTIGLKLNVNMNYYNGIAEDNVNGESSKTTAFLDRTLSHEFTHAVMSTNIQYFNSLPQFIKEGMAELTHGIDDERGSRIFDLAYDASRLNTALNLTNTSTGTSDAYAGGYMFLRYFARQAALQSLVDYNPATNASWSVTNNKNDSTATCKIGSVVVATIKGLAKGLAAKGTTIDGITISGDKITLSKNVLGTANVTLTSNDYTLALGDDLAGNIATISNKAWTVSKGTATLKGNLTAGYTLLETGKTITYTAAKNNQTLATVKGLATTGVTSSDFSTTDNVITLKKSMLGTSKVTVTGDGYTLALAADAPEPELQTPYWAFNNTTGYYRQNTSAGFTLANDAKSAAYSKLATTNLATVSGIKKVTSANKAAIEADLTVNGQVITLGADALATSKVAVKGDGYTLTLAADAPKPTLQPEYWTVGGTAAAYKQDTSAGFTLANDAKSATYSKLKTVTLATVNGIQKVNANNKDEIADAITISGKVITLGKDALATSKVTVAGNGYTLALDEDAPKPTLQPEYWTVGGTAAAYKQDTSAGFTLANDAKSATYSKLKTVTLATVKGIKKVTSANKDEIADAITISGKVITLGKDALATSKVTVAGEGYTLALATDAPKPTLQPEYWTVGGTAAAYKQDSSAGFTLANDAKSATYSKLKTVTLATVKGIKKVTSANKDEIADAITIDGKVITLGKDALATSKVTVAGEGYTLALATDAPTPTLQPEYWTVGGTAAAYKQDTSAGFTLANDAKSAAYSKLKTVTLATVNGIQKVNANNKAAITDAITISGKVITLGADALTNTKVTVTGTGYILAMDSSLTDDTPEELWTVSGTTATFDRMRYAYFSPSTNKQTFTYNKTAKLATLVKVTGLVKGATVNDDGNISDKDGKTILALNNTALTVANNDSFGNKVEVTLSNGYTLNNQLTTPAVTTTYWAVKNGTASLKQEKTDGYTLSTNAKTGAQILTYNAAKTGKTTLTLATVSGLDKTLTDTDGTLSGLAYDLTGKTITANNSVLTKSNLTLKGDFTLNLSDAPTSPDPATLWEVSGTKAVYKDVKIGYFTRKNDKTFTYTKEKVLTTHATISGLRNNAALDSFTLKDGVITLTADALVENPNAKTKIALSTKENYTLKLADGVANVEYNDPAWSYSSGKSTYKSSVKTAGYLPSDDAKTITYITTKDSKGNAVTKTLSTVSGVKSASGITVDGDVIKLTAAALNNKNVTLGKTDPYTLALGDSSLAPAPLTEETWKKTSNKSGNHATLTATYSTGYTPSADSRTLTYSAKNTVKTLASISGINKNADINTFQAVADGDTKKISLSAAQLTNKVTLGGVYKFDFASDYNNATITGSAAADNISVAGTGLSITGGKGNDYVDFGSGANTFIYATGDGDDVIADFTTNDKIKITKGTPAVESDGEEAIVTVGAGSIKLLGAAGQTITILDANNKAKTYSTTAPSANLLLDDNYTASAQLGEIVKPAQASYTPYDFAADFSLTKENKITPALTYSKEK